MMLGAKEMGIVLMFTHRSLEMVGFCTVMIATSKQLVDLGFVLISPTKKVANALPKKLLV